MPDLANGLSLRAGNNSLQQRYLHVLALDRKMRETIRQMPPILLGCTTGNRNDAPSWLALAQRSLAITAADKVSPDPLDLKAYTYSYRSS